MTSSLSSVISPYFSSKVAVALASFSWTRSATLSLAFAEQCVHSLLVRSPESGARHFHIRKDRIGLLDVRHQKALFDLVTHSCVDHPVAQVDKQIKIIF
jgi:hypothetical protein